MANGFPPEPGPLPSDYLPGEQPGARPMGITFRPGTQLAGYELGEQIGRGGMAVVYRARDVRLDRWVALKILAPEIARDESFRQRFIRESRAAAAVDHPNIIPVFEAGDADGVLFIAMRYVDAGDVGTLARSGPLDVARVNSIVAQIAAALDAAHAVGLVHRDVKPANMLIGALAASGRPDHVYLSDFGLSKQSVSAPGLTLTGQFMGTLDYMAPEQIEGKTVDGRADLYALACAAFELLTGAPPFRRDHDLALLWAQVSEPPPRPSQRRPGLPAAVDDVLLRALAKQPGQRQASCLEFAAQLQEACGLAWGANGQLGQSRPPTEIARPATEVSAPSGPSSSAPPPAAPTQHSGPGIPAAAQPGAALPFPGPPTSGPGVGTSGWRADPAAPTSAPGQAGHWDQRGQAPQQQAGWGAPSQGSPGWPAQPPAGDAGWMPGMGQGGGQGTQAGGYQQAPRRRGALIAGLVVLFVAAAAVTAFLLTRGHVHPGREGREVHADQPGLAGPDEHAHDHAVVTGAARCARPGGHRAGLHLGHQPPQLPAGLEPGRPVHLVQLRQLQGGFRGHPARHADDPVGQRERGHRPPGRAADRRHGEELRGHLHREQRGHRPVQRAPGLTGG